MASRNLPNKQKYSKWKVLRFGRSKVADMAKAANFSGNDIMGYNNDNSNDTNRCQDGL
ncbi:MAG: hypothetical protein ACRD8Z_06615 [Nitrososphaeraceae archaeon]